MESETCLYRLLLQKRVNMPSKLPPNSLLPKAAAPGRPTPLPPPRYIPQAPAVQSKPLQSAPPAYTPFKNGSGMPNPSGPMDQQKVSPAKPPLQMKGGPISTTGLPPQVFRPSGTLASNPIQLACNLLHPGCPPGPCRLGALNQKGLQPGQKKPKQTSHHQHPRPKGGARKRRRG
jgi:hypothetical protein